MGNNLTHEIADAPDAIERKGYRLRIMQPNGERGGGGEDRDTGTCGTDSSCGYGQGWMIEYQWEAYMLL